MSFRSLALTIAVFSSMQVASADAQSAYVAPGGVYIGAGPVYVAPARKNRAGRHAAGRYRHYYGPPALVSAPAVVVPATAYYDAPLSAYATELPPWARPYYWSGQCPTWEAC